MPTIGTNNATNISALSQFRVVSHLTSETLTYVKTSNLLRINYLQQKVELPLHRSTAQKNMRVFKDL